MASQKSFKELQFSKLHFFLASVIPKRVLLQALVEYKLLNFHKMIEIKSNIDDRYKMGRYFYSNKRGNWIAVSYEVSQN